MDRQSTIGFVLIAVVLMVWMWFNTPPPQKPRDLADTTHAVARSITDTAKARAAQRQQEASGIDGIAKNSGFGEIFSSNTVGAEKLLTVETDLYKAQITTKGGLIRQWELKQYKTWNMFPVQLVDLDKGGDFSLLFNSKEGKQINTRNLFFRSDFPANKQMALKGDDSISIDLVLPVSEGKRIVKRLTFHGNRYTLGAELFFEGMNDIISGFEYQVLWETPLPYAEHNSVDESHFAKADVFSGGEVTEVDAAKEGEPVTKDMNGQTDWVATRNKYFAVAIIPDPGSSQGAIVDGKAKSQPDHGMKEEYSLALKMPYKGLAKEGSKFTVFLGPLDFSLIKSMNIGLDNIMSLGMAWLIRPITEYIMMPLFNFLHLFISNWGLVIIAFSIVIKIALHPLTKKQMDSMRKMSKLSPMMTEIREKYADDAQKMNSEMMKLYKDYGINPAGGCLPLLLQMPILYALYNVFSSTIQLRQAPFFGWIRDLSIPDTIFHLPFKIPLFGMDQVSGLALAMGVTMFVQQKQSVTDPRQKAMVWMMPIMMTIIFASLPSGLNLYYFVFNLLSIGQQYFVNKTHGDEPLKKVDPKKAQGGLIGMLAKNIPDINKMNKR